MLYRFWSTCTKHFSCKNRSLYINGLVNVLWTCLSDGALSHLHSSNGRVVLFILLHKLWIQTFKNTIGLIARYRKADRTWNFYFWFLLLTCGQYLKCMMKFIRFCFYTYFKHYEKRDGDIANWSATFMMTVIIIFNLFTLAQIIGMIYYHNRIYLIVGGRLGVWTLFLSIELPLYLYFIRKRRTELIIDEFANSNYDTKRNRIYAWLFFVLSFLVPCIIAVLFSKFIPY